MNRDIDGERWDDPLPKPLERRAARSHAGRKRPRPARLLAGAFVSGLLTMSVVDAATGTDPSPVGLVGAGASTVLGTMTAWQDDMYSAPTPVDVQYFGRGSTEGRASFLRNESDFVITGTAFTADELATQPAGSPEFVKVPIEINTLAVLADFHTDNLTPDGKLAVFTEAPCDPGDESVPDPSICHSTLSPYDGPFRLPPKFLAATILNLPPTFEDNGFRRTSSTEVTSLYGSTTLRFLLGLKTAPFILRSEGASTNLWLQDYVKTLAPDVWDLKKKETVNTGWAWEPLQEKPIPTRVLSRTGLETVLGLVAAYNINPVSNANVADEIGNMTGIPVTMLPHLRESYPKVPFFVAEIQNANGDYVGPTVEAANASLAVGTDPNIAAHQPIGGGYPLMWTNYLYVRATGLGREKAAALSALIRYLVTDGQAKVTELGGVSITAAQRAEALAAADRLVGANCTDADSALSAGPRGALEPDLPGVGAIATMQHCDVVPTTTTTTTTTSTTTTTTTTVAETTTTATTTTTTEAATTVPAVAVVSRTNSAPSAPAPTVIATAAPVTTLPPDTVPPETATTVAEVVESAPATAQALAVATTRAPTALQALPMPLPSDGTKGYKRLGTFILGALGYVLVRTLASGRVGGSR